MNDRNETLIGVAIIAILLLFGSSLLIAVINLGTKIASFWFLLLVQIALAALLLVIVASMMGALASWVSGRIADLYEKHRELAKEIRKRTPWFVALTVLVAQATVAVADKSFQGQELPTVAVTLVLIILFYLSNELIVQENLPRRIAGFALWFFAVLALPLFVVADRHFDFNAVLSLVGAFPLFYKIFYTLIVVVFLFTPLLFISRKDA